MTIHLQRLVWFGLALLASCIVAPVASAQTTYYWDSNGTGTAGAGATPTGTWGTSVFWSTDSTGANVGSPVLTATTTNTDNLFFVAGPGAASGNNAYVVTVNLAQVANSLTFQASGATTLSGGTSITLGNGTDGLGGINIPQFAFGSTANGAVTIATAVILANNQTWTNNSASNLNMQSVINTNGRTLTFDGSGTFNLDSASAGISGSGGIIKNGSGLLIFSTTAAPTYSFTGNITLNAGYIGFQTSSVLTGRNTTITGGYLGGRFGSGFTWTGGLGTGANQIQITGGTSGFSGEGTSGSIFQIGAASSTLVWGAAGEGTATGFFNPSVLIANGSARSNVNGVGSLNNGLDLNGTTRTINSFQTTDGAATSGFTISGVISNSGGTAAGLTKTGVGNLILGSASNSFNGALTITGGWITAGSSGALGGVSNSIVFNGGILRATGTITSPSTRSVTMTSTGIIDTNGQAISIAGNITGAGGLTKNSTGTLTLSGTNNFGGVTTVNAGTLAITTQAALASNTAANLNVKSGATLQLNVDSAGTAGFTAANLNTLFTNISVANTAAEGLQSGVNLAIDTSTATGATFTQGNAITNSTGAFGGAIGLTKLGAGTLVFDKANTYSGLTTISAGTLQLVAGGVIATAISNNATFAINSAGSVTQGTNFGLIVGTGAVTNVGAGTLTLNLANTYTGNTTVSAGTIAITNSLALQNSAYNTTGSNGTTIGLDVTSGLSSGTLILGGLAGSVSLASAFTAGFTSVTNLTLNPQTGITSTYSGIISNGSGAMTLTKTGAGTQILTGANSYTGATIVNAGTLTIGVGGSLSSSSDLQINGGTFSYGNTGAGLTLNGFTVGAGNATVSNTAAAQTLALGAITRTASVFGTVNFATLTGPISTTTGNTNSIIGPWATTASTTTLRYAVGSPDGSTPTNITAFTGTTATAGTLANVTDATVNYEYSAAATTAANLTGNTLRYSGAATTTTIGATNTLTLNGLMNAGFAGPLVITGGPTTGGILIGSTGELVITANAQGTTISAAIGGTGRLVYNGAGSRLLLSSATSNYSGGTVINSGQLAIASDAALGLSTGSITLNGGTLVGNTTNPQVGNSGGVNITSARDVIVGPAGGGIGAHGNNSFTTTGKLTGTGTLTFTDVGGAGGRALNFNATTNDFTGRLIVLSNSMTVSVNSLGDSTNSIALNSGAVFSYGTGATAAMSLPNRVIELTGTTGATINNANTTAANAITIGGGVVVTGVGNKTLTLGGANTGNNTFSGSVTDGPGSVISLTKADAGTWVLGGTNTYSGATTVTTGTLATTTAIQGFGSNLSGISIGGSGTLRLLNNTTTSFTNGTSAYNIFNSATGATINVDRVSGTGSNTITVGDLPTSSTAATWQLNFTGSNGVSLSAGALTTPTAAAGANTISNSITGGGSLTLASITGGGTGATSSLAFTGNGNTIVTGAITQTATAQSLSKSGTGTLTLSGVNTFSGATTISGGTLRLANTSALASTSGIALNTASNSIVFGTDTAFTTLAGITGASGAFTYSIVSDRATAGAALNHTLGIITFGSATFNIVSGSNVTSGTAGITLLTATMTSGSGGTAILNPTTATLTITGGVTSQANNLARTLQLDGTGTGHSIGGTITQTVASALSLSKTNTSTWTLSGTNTYIGTTTISAGSLQLGSGSTTGSLTATTAITNNANLTINRSNAFSQATDLGAGVAITGTGSFTQAGAGTTTLTAVNTYTGATRVNAGTLLIGSTGTLAAGSTVTVGGATATGTPTLGGTGTINGAVVISAAGGGAAGTLSTGTSSSPGTLNVNNSVTFNGGSFVWKINNTVTPTGFATQTNGQSNVGAANQDRLAITGGTNTLTASATSTFALTQIGTFATALDTSLFYSFTVATTAGAPVVSGMTVNTDAAPDFAAYVTAGGTLAVVAAGDGNVYLNLTAPVPEPTTILGISAMGVMLARFSRRRLAR